MTTVLIVDDSSFIRRTLAVILEKDPDIKVAGMAKNGEEALSMVRTLDPDVVTLDVEMPRMNGLTALTHIMKESPRPVLMISSLTQEGADTTLKALDIGALDFMPKLSTGAGQDMDRMEGELRAKIKALGRRKAFVRLLHRHNRDTVRTPAHDSLRSGIVKKPDNNRMPVVAGTASRLSMPLGRSSFDLVAIGVSTGGPPAVQKILTSLPENFPAPILIAQHMPASFTGPFAKRLDSNCAIKVKEAEHGENLRSATAYICPGGRHLSVKKNKAGLLVAGVDEEPKEALYKPSANVLMESAGLVLGRRALGVTLTGMGNDGVIGTGVLKEKGGRTIAQSEASCVVYGMPKAVVDAGLADLIVDIDDMAAVIMEQMVR